MKVAVGLRRVAAGKRTSGRRAAQIAVWAVRHSASRPDASCGPLREPGRSDFQGPFSLAEGLHGTGTASESHPFPAPDTAYSSLKSGKYFLHFVQKINILPKG